ncbi:MAG: hypothetical protein AAF413_00470 [Patescibacteria group bacterium]
MKRRNLGYIFIAAGLVFIFMSGSGSDTSTQSATTNTEPSITLEDGMRARQIVFESNEPEYPDEQKIIYTFDETRTPDPELHPADQSLYEIVSDLAPSDQDLESIVEFEVYFDEEDGTLASVAALDNDNGEWVYSINYISVTEFTELIPTIVHEYGHIISLTDSQTTTESEQEGITESCRTLILEEGCLAFNSYLNRFNRTFWNAQLDPGEDRTEDEAAEYFQQNSDSYVTEYATTNVAEDFSESFMVYVTGDLPDPSSELEKDKKVLFFDEYKELKDYRQNARDKILSWAK